MNADVDDLERRAYAIAVELVRLDLAEDHADKWHRAKEIAASDDQILTAMLLQILSAWGTALVQSLAHQTGEDPIAALQEFALKNQQGGGATAD
jgi:hypothetical protein